MDYYADIENRKSGVYKIINLVNGKMYIGCSKHILYRWQGHKANLKSNKHRNYHLQLAWNKYGKDNFSFEILEICAKEDIFIREDFWVKHYNSTDDKVGYNIRLTSSTGNPGMQEQTKRKLSKSVYQYEKTGELVKKWDCMSDAAKATGSRVAIMTRTMKIERYTHHNNFIWSRNPMSKLEVLKKSKIFKIYKLDMNENLLETYNSMKEAAEGNNISESLLQKHFKGDRDSYNKRNQIKFLWKKVYVYEEIESEQ